MTKIVSIILNFNYIPKQFKVEIEENQTISISIPREILNNLDKFIDFHIKIEDFKEGDKLIDELSNGKFKNIFGKNYNSFGDD